MFTFRKWFLEKGLCRAAKTPRRKPINSKVRLESLEERVNPAPTVVTDLLDFAPGSTALITANNFKVGSEVVFQVSHMISAGVDGIWGTPDDVVDTEKNAMSSDHQPWAVTDGVWWRVNAGADNIEGTSDDVIAGDLDKCENGSIETSWFVNPDDSVGATFALTATGLDPDSVKITAMSMFTDAIKTDFRGWENIESAGVDWANGGINAGQGLYLEGDYIPHAVNFSGLTVGSDYTFNISFNYFQASSNSGGFVDIGTYNQSVAPTLVFPVGSGSPLSDATTMPDSGGVFYISTYGGTIDADVTNVTQSLAISTTEKQSTVTFKALDTSATFYYGLRLAVPGEVLVPAGVTPNTNPTNGADGFTGLSLQSSVKNGPDGPAIGGGGNVQVAPGAVVQGSISGVKWSDLNGNGIKESNEPGLAGWTIQIYKDADGDEVFGVGDTLINSTTTADGKTDANKDGKIDANDLGYYNFAALRGTYFVREVQQVGWTQTFPNNNIHGPLNINETTPQYVNQNFGNMRDKPTIDITKEHTGIVNEGTIDQVLVYTFTVTNTSAVTTGSETITSLTDTILGDLFAAFKAANGGSAVIAAGATVSFTVNYTAPVANAFVSIANIVTVVGNDDQGNFVTDSASDIEFYKDLQPAITIVKTPDPTSVLEGGIGNQMVTYTYLLTNTSMAGAFDPLSNINVSDTDGVPVYVSGDDGDNLLEKGETWIYTLTVAMPIQDAFTVHENTVTATGKDDEANPATGMATAKVTYTDYVPTSIKINKSHTGTIYEGTGDQTLVYTYTVFDDETVPTDPIKVTLLVDDIIGDILSYFIAANGNSDILQPGGSVTFDVAYTPVPVANAKVELTNVVLVVGEDNEGNVTTDSATDTAVYLDLLPAIDIMKSHSGTINEGTSDQVLVYSFTVSNMSTASTDPVTVSSLSDTVLGDLFDAFKAANGDSAVIPFGGSVTFTVDYTAPVANAGVVIANTVVVIGQDDEQNPVEDSASDEVAYQDVKPMIDIMKSHTGTINEGESGQVLTYSFTVTNTSTATTDPVTVSSLSDTVLGDLLGAFKAANGGSAVLPFGGSVTFTVDYTAPVANAGVVIANTVVVIGQDDEQNPVEDSASDEVAYQDVKPMIDIMKSHTGTINEGTSDQVLTYSFTVMNMSTATTDPLTVSSLSDSVLGNLLPAFLAANGDSAVIPFGGSVTFTVDYTAPVANAGVVIANTVTVIGQDDEQNLIEDSASDAETYKNLNPSITVTKTPDKTEVVLGSTVTYTYYLTNTSIAGAFDPLSGITLVDTDGAPSYVSGDSNINSILEVGETWKYVLTYTTTSYGVHNNTVTASGKDDENISTVGYASAAINVTGQQANGKTLGYYSNKNGQKDLTGSPKGTTLLSSIYNNLFAPNTGLLAKDSVYSVLVDGSGNYKPLSFFSSYANVRSYLLGANATNMAYMLSVQLLTTEFNIQFGRISALKSILASAVAMPMASQNSLSNNNGANSWMQVSYSGVANIQTILDAAIASLKASPNTISSGPDRVYQEGLKCLLDAMNNNQSIFLP